MGGIITGIIFFIVVVLVCRAKNSFNDAHPKQCSICGKMDSSTIALKDGCMCYQCGCVKYAKGSINLAFAMDDSRFKLYTTEEMKNYLETIRHRGEQMAYFRPTRMSQDGIIQVDDNLGLFIINGEDENNFAHNIADIESFKLVIDKDYITCEDSILIDGGHIVIKLREPMNEISVCHYGNNKIFGAKQKVKKDLEPDVKFLEEITGLRRK